VVVLLHLYPLTQIICCLLLVLLLSFYLPSSCWLRLHSWICCSCSHVPLSLFSVLNIQFDVGNSQEKVHKYYVFVTLLCVCWYVSTRSQICDSCLSVHGQARAVRAREGKAPAHQIVFNFYHYGQFKNTSGISSDAPNTAVQFEHATIFILNQNYFLPLWAVQER
jgi:hypothetical protein